jgi:general secretion pathway protein L
MTETLLLRLHTPSSDAAVEACLWDGGPASARPLGRLGLAEAATQASGRRVVAVLPAADVLALTLTLPEAAPAKLRASLPFALEEQVAGDIEAQHCALGSRGADGRWPVRVIARARLEAWLGLLRGAGIEPQAVVSAADGLRDKPGDLMLWWDGDETHWRAPGDAPLTLPADGSWETGLAAALGTRPAGTLGLVLHAQADEAAIEPALAALRQRIAPVQRIELTDGALAAFAPTYTAAVNLLQADFAPRRAAEGDRRSAWRWPLRLVAVVVLLQLAGFALEAWRLHRAAGVADAAMLAAARPLQPGINDPEAARALLRERLAAWSRAAADPATAPVLAPLAQLAAAKGASPSMQLVALATDAEGRVRARFATADDAGLAAATSALAASGWTRDDAGSDPSTTTSVPDAGAFAASWRSPPRTAERR